MADTAPAVPTASECLKCQLLGRRRLTCSKTAECSTVPFAFWLGPALLAGWIATVIGFVLAVR